LDKDIKMNLLEQTLTIIGTISTLTVGSVWAMYIITNRRITNLDERFYKMEEKWDARFSKMEEKWEKLFERLYFKENPKKKA